MANSSPDEVPSVYPLPFGQKPDVLLLQELKGTELPAEVFSGLGYESVAVTQKAYNGVAILSRLPIEQVSNALSGDESDTHARYLEVVICGIRIVDIYLPNGNPIGTEKFEYKLAWMERLLVKMSQWKADGVPTVIGGDFNVIPEDIDCHKPASWISRCPISARTACALPCHAGYGLYRCLSVIACRGRPIHVLGLFPTGF